MADEDAKEPNEKAEREPPETTGSRRRSLTPEQRRFLNKSRAVPNEPPREQTPPPADAKLNYLRYLMASRHTPKMEVEGADPYPGVAPADLVQQALLSEHAGKWQDAVERFMAAKRKNLGHRGILFRVGKILYDHRNFEAADTAFERAIAFGENVEASDYYRGLIAVRRRDLATAEQFFDSAVSAAPFVSDYHSRGLWKRLAAMVLSVKELLGKKLGPFSIVKMPAWALCVAKKRRAAAIPARSGVNFMTMFSAI